MTKTLYIMQGVPGSGKSTLAKRIAPEWAVFSTDDFWYEQSKDYKYEFDGSRLGEAHEWNQQRVRKALTEGRPLVAVDNTNINQRSAQPYIDMAKEFGYDVQIVRVTASLETCLKRNAERSADRRIPEDVIKRMVENMENIVV